MPIARIGIGSNIGDAAANVRAAFDRLSALGTVTARSSLYRSRAWGVTAQPDFWNAAALLETSLAPYDLLRGLQELERSMGRLPTYRWGPRVIDLDILSYDQLAIDEPELTIPHARLRERAFALAPLAEIDPAFAPLYEALAETERAQVVRFQQAPGSTRA